MSDIDCERGGAVAALTTSPVRTAAQMEQLLDAALGDTFPASDPVSELRVSFPAVEVMKTIAAGSAPP